MYSPLGVLLEEWCRIDGHDVITTVGVVRNGNSVGRVGGLTWSHLGMVFTTFLLHPPIRIHLYCLILLLKSAKSNTPTMKMNSTMTLRN